MRHRKAVIAQESYAVPSAVSSGVTDLMTSLAVIFILLFAAYVNRVHEKQEPHAQSSASPQEQQPALDASVPMDKEHKSDVLMVTMPEAALTFEFGESRLLPTAEAFLSEMIPQYAARVCAQGGKEVDAFVIEGYTDDLGDDLRNLRLSQERSFAVLAKSVEVVRERLPWAYECFLQKATANGRGRQNLLRDEAGDLDRERSRRVIFKIHLRPQ
ncbi:MAG: OmpA family protein [Nitrospira sp.]|nr:OmpA family protein [Nitrospira sp.]MDH4302935.1 OmpA family protein [Nitrospira sp.]MDH5192584.1 OmpA family protein [Nitrospira sp.]